jgi:hypothetical protein
MKLAVTKRNAAARRPASKEKRLNSAKAFSTKLPDPDSAIIAFAGISFRLAPASRLGAVPKGTASSGLG